MATLHVNHEVPIDTMLKLRAEQKKLEQEMANEMMYLDQLASAGPPSRRRTAKRPASASTAPRTVRGAGSGRNGMSDPTRPVYLHEGYAQAASKSSSSRRTAPTAKRPSTAAALRRKEARTAEGEQIVAGTGSVGVGGHIDIKDVKAMVERERLLLSMLSQQDAQQVTVAAAAAASAKRSPPPVAASKGPMAAGKPDLVERIKQLEAHVADLEGQLKKPRKPTKTEADVQLADERCAALELQLAEERGMREAVEAEKVRVESNCTRQVQLLVSKNSILERDAEHQRERGRREGAEERKEEREEHAKREEALREENGRVVARCKMLEEQVEGLGSSLKRSEQAVEGARDAMAKLTLDGGQAESAMQERFLGERREKEKLMEDLFDASKREAKLLLQLKEAREKLKAAEAALEHSGSRSEQKLTIDALHKKLAALATANEALKNELVAATGRARSSPTKKGDSPSNLYWNLPADHHGPQRGGVGESGQLPALRSEMSALRSQIAVLKGKCERLEAENGALQNGRMTVTPTAQRALSRPRGGGDVKVTSAGGKVSMSPAKTRPRQRVGGDHVTPGSGALAESDGGGSDASRDVASPAKKLPVTKKALLPAVELSPAPAPAPAKPDSRDAAPGSSPVADAHAHAHDATAGSSGVPLTSDDADAFAETSPLHYGSHSPSGGEFGADVPMTPTRNNLEYSPLPSVSPSLSYDQGGATPKTPDEQGTYPDATSPTVASPKVASPKVASDSGVVSAPSPGHDEGSVASVPSTPPSPDSIDDGNHA